MKKGVIFQIKAAIDFQNTLVQN